MIEITRMEKRSELAPLESEWDALVAGSDDDNPFRQWIWLTAWWRHYGSGHRLAVLLARDGGELVGIAPLYLDLNHRWAPGRVLKFLGTGHICSEYLGFIARRGRESQVTAAFLDHILRAERGGWDMLELTDIPESSGQVRAIASYLGQHRLPSSRQLGPVNRIAELPATWDAYLTGLPSRRRTRFRRIMKDYDRLPGVRFSMVEHADDLPLAWERLKTLHETHWVQEGIDGCFACARFDGFHAEIVRTLFDRDMLFLGTLECDGLAVASCYCVVHGGTIYEYQRGHDPAWLDRRPGHALQFYMFRQAIERGCRAWDFLRGEYQHKRDWSTDTRGSVGFTIPAPRAAPLAEFYLREGFRNVKRRVRDWRDAHHARIARHAAANAPEPVGGSAE